ncbi:hemerythrin domain-containing protein [Denitromonas iodatirespirans]|uniref:Hemerythrin domain-containing protein n=1 Tax=Denitromonas iodatirespirans TaxID=2795389 RepID=A0A944HFL6_DENI1|nr:hemerythrin domain-containing protein [Denitromonas iodatirespirans]MBT0963821.1 hemerythrin domain-containing protein [Denitromonas iodatirespirans]
MTQAIDIIKDEHRSMGAVIKGLQAQVSAAQNGDEAPDFFLFGAMLDYIEALPDRVHHPKEDEYLFRFVRLRSAEAAAILDTLEAEHARCAELLAGLRQALGAARDSSDLSGFAAALDHYASFLWAHMRMEEEQILPLAAAHLTDEDWQVIDAAFAANRGGQW